MWPVFSILKEHWAKLALLAIGLTILRLPCTAQTFKADQYGYVASPAFGALVKQRNYQLVAAFDTVQDQQLNKVLATIVKDGMPYYLDLNGNELPYVDPLGQAIKARDRVIRKPQEDAEKKYRQLTTINKAFLNTQVGKLYGLIRKTDSAVILPNEYEWLQCCIGNYILFMANGKWGVADTLGRIFIKPVYDGIEACMGDTSGINLFSAQKNGLRTLVNRNGSEMFPPAYYYITPFAVDGLLYSLQPENGAPRYGLLDKEGNVLLAPYSRELNPMLNLNFLRTEKTGKGNYDLGLVNKQGKIILEPVYSRILSEENGFIAFYKDEKQGLVNSYGKIVLDTIYTSATADTLNQTILISLEQPSKKAFRAYKYGLMDYHNKFLIPLEYDELNLVEHHYYFGKKNGTYFLLNRFGKTLHQFAYSYMQYVYYKGYFIAMDNNRQYGVVDLLGKVKIPFKYTNIEPTGGYYFAANNCIYTPENECVVQGYEFSVTYTNNLELRKRGLFVLRESASVVIKDRYGNDYRPKSR